MISEFVFMLVAKDLARRNMLQADEHREKATAQVAKKNLRQADMHVALAEYHEGVADLQVKIAQTLAEIMNWG